MPGDVVRDGRHHMATAVKVTQRAEHSISQEGNGPIETGPQQLSYIGIRVLSFHNLKFNRNRV